MKITRVYVNAKGLKLSKYPHGSHYVVIEVDENKVELTLEFDGNFYIAFYHDEFPVIPSCLNGKVKRVSRLCSFESGTCHAKNVLPGKYTVQEGKFRAEVEEKMIKGKVGINVCVCAQSLAVLQKFWPKLLAGELTAKHQYQPSIKSRPFALAARKE